MTAKTIRGVLTLLLGMAVLLPAGPALAQTAPPNDDFSAATTIGALPFTDSADTTGASSAADDPVTCGNNGSVWYAFTPQQNEALSADTFGSDYATVLSVYTGARGALTAVACNNSSGSAQTIVDFNATAGTTYFFLISQCCGTGGSGGGHLVFNLSILQPPANDNFSSATQITTLPFTGTADTTAATLEPGEPAPCTFPPLAGSVWYAFTPATTESVSASVSSNFFSLLAVYTGTSVGKLTSLGCGLSDEAPVTMHLNAGTTYYFQAGGFSEAGPLTFQLVVTPPPTAELAFAPTDPSIFDTIQFFDDSYDPGNAGRTETWDFGDGTTGTGPSPTHTYAADGDHTVKLTITTTDGRTATTSQVVHVVTHDVAITTFTVPTSARPGATRSITVGVSDNRYPETVQVQLLKGNIQGGFDVVGTMTLPVPVKPAGHTTQFTFSYTFTSGDAAIGKVTFEATATLQGARDALPADNTAIATTSVR